MNLASRQFEITYPTPRPLAGGPPILISFARGPVNYVTSVEAFDHERPTSVLVSGRINATANARYRAIDRRGNEGMEPHFRPFLMNSWAISGRWWANRWVDMTDRGDFTLRIPLAPENWTDSFGKFPNFSTRRARDWRRTLNRSHVGITFGGGLNFGHGVDVTQGRCTVEIDTFRVD